MLASCGLDFSQACSPTIEYFKFVYNATMREWCGCDGGPCNNWPNNTDFFLVLGRLPDNFDPKCPGWVNAVFVRNSAWDEQL
jgi:hypothetical protein